jgi:hypothetical protein
MKPSREEFERERAEREESVRRFRERVARMKADLEDKRRAEAEPRQSTRRRRFFLFR